MPANLFATKSPTAKGNSLRSTQQRHHTVVAPRPNSNSPTHATTGCQRRDEHLLPSTLDEGILDDRHFVPLRPDMPRVMLQSRAGELQLLS